MFVTIFIHFKHKCLLFTLRDKDKNTMNFRIMFSTIYTVPQTFNFSTHSRNKLNYKKKQSAKIATGLEKLAMFSRPPAIFTDCIFL